MQTNNQQPKIRINYQIRVPQIRLLANDGDNLGVINTREALQMAQDQSLDLVEINPRAMPPVCRLMDYGKFKYEEKKKAQISKKNQQNQELKSLTLRPVTDDHDMNHKLEQAKEFLNDGHKVKFTVRFRGREITHPQVGQEKLEWFIQQLANLIISNPSISLDGKFMSVTVNPTKKQ